MKSFNNRDIIPKSKVNFKDTYILKYGNGLKYVIMRRVKGESQAKTPFDPCANGYITVKSYMAGHRKDDTRFSAHCGQFWSAVSLRTTNIYKATDQESEWLDRCIKAGKLVPNTTMDYAIY